MLRTTRLLSVASPFSRSRCAALRATALDINATTPRGPSWHSLPHTSRAPMPSQIPPITKVYYSGSPYDKIDTAAEKRTAKKRLEPRPDEVSTESTTRQVFEPAPVRRETQGNLTDDLQHDIEIVKDTFRMEDVPRKPLVLGLAGTIPYLFTSISTVYLSWDLNTSWPSSSAILNHIYMNHEDAKALLALLEPVQLGYGAVIISFLGAVHWGMEYAARDISAARTKFRYAIGVIAPAVAWPTLLMPVEAALTSQFLAFTFLYLADSRATTRGWTPTWYGRYRFILTAIVGAAIFVSLVGRAKVGSAAPRLGQGLSDSMHKRKADPNVNWAKLEEEEKQRNRKAKEEAELEEEKSPSRPEGQSKDGKEHKSSDKEAEEPTQDEKKGGKNHPYSQGGEKHTEVNEGRKSKGKGKDEGGDEEAQSKGPSKGGKGTQGKDEEKEKDG